VGRGAQYRANRLKGDRPEISQRLANGEFKFVAELQSRAKKNAHLRGLEAKPVRKTKGNPALL